MSFTPGPWEVWPPGHEVKAVHGYIGMDDSQLMPVILLGDGVNRDDNARLIAAAPDLLDACNGMIDLIDAWMNGILKTHGISWSGPECHPPALKAARAAIAKVDGVETDKPSSAEKEPDESEV